MKETIWAEKLRLMQKGTDDASCQATFEGITRELQNVMEPPPLPIGFRVKGTFCMEVHSIEARITGLF